jgi:16S rRNA processing protein RimM
MSTDGEHTRVVVGRIGKAHGIRGAVTVEIRTDFPELRFREGAELFAGDPVNATLVVERAQEHSGRLLVWFEGSTDRTSAELFRGALLETESGTEMTPLDEDEFLVRDLIGVRVQGEDGNEIGRIDHVIHLPGHDLLAVATPAGEKLIPFVSEIVTEVVITGSPQDDFVLVSPPPGLLDEVADAD